MTPEIHNVGTDEVDFVSEWISKPQLTSQLDWIVYYYEDHTDDYYGSGHAVGFLKANRQLYTKSLGHCSCYGPADGDAGEWLPVQIEEFLSPVEATADEISPAIKAKVAELLTPSDDETSFLGAIKSGDETARFLYADWLDEQGHSASARWFRETNADTLKLHASRLLPSSESV